MSHYVYILANRPHGAIYIGTARHLHQRMKQHRTGSVRGYARRYNISQLVWFERHETTVDALHRERRLKRRRREWKDELIESKNPEWSDMMEQIPYDN